MDVSGYHHADSIVINRPPEAVYDLVADITGMGRLSPVCVAGVWEPPATGAAVGAWFAGTNRVGDFEWTTKCRVDAAERGKEFRFVNCGGNGDVELVEWGYQFRPADGGTEVTETWQVLPAYPDFLRTRVPEEEIKARIDDRETAARDGIAATLANLKAIAEG
jgi:hypothetical protein